MESSLVSRNQILTQLARSPHGKLSEYTSIVRNAVSSDPEFTSHLIAWNEVHGSIRDSKVALPVASLAVSGLDSEFAENSFAHIAKLGPREILRAYRYALEVRLPGNMSRFRRIVEQYLREREVNPRTWDRVAVQHRKTLKELYALAHVKPGSDYYSAVLFGRDLSSPPNKVPVPSGSIFETIANLSKMDSTAAAGAIISERIPFLIAMGALGAKAKDTDLVLALINQMTATELVTNTKMLEKLGIKTNPALRGAFEKAISKASTNTKNLLKTTRAAEAMEDETLKEKLRGLQEKQIASHKGIEGSWLVLGDKSGSMASCIEASRHIASTLAKFVKGKVNLVFFDTAPRHFDVTGKSYDEILKLTRYITADGGTSVGVGLQYAIEKGFEIDGIAVVTDGGENTNPIFADQYQRFVGVAGKEVPVYEYLIGGPKRNTFNAAMERKGYTVEQFDLNGGKLDYYGLPSLVETMRSNRFSLVDEILATPLLTLSDVFKKTEVKELITA